jgi:formate hydrogenlyase subunit 4
VSVVGVIVLVLVALLPAAMLLAGLRRAAIARAEARAGGPDREVQSFRSHAEASRQASNRGR